MEAVILFYLCHRCEQNIQRVVQRWVPKNPETPVIDHPVQSEQTTPPVEVPVGSSSRGWLAATKVARQARGTPAEAISRSGFAVLQGVDEAGEAVNPLLDK